MLASVLPSSVSYEDALANNPSSRKTSRPLSLLLSRSTPMVLSFWQFLFGRLRIMFRLRADDPVDACMVCQRRDAPAAVQLDASRKAVPNDQSLHNGIQVYSLWTFEMDTAVWLYHLWQVPPCASQGWLWGFGRDSYRRIVSFVVGWRWFWGFGRF